MSDSEQENEGYAVPECTEAHVFQSIQQLEYQADDELANGIDYHQFDLGERFDGDDLAKEYYEPVIKRALGIRHLPWRTAWRTAPSPNVTRPLGTISSCGRRRTGSPSSRLEAPAHALRSSSVWRLSCD